MISLIIIFLSQIYCIKQNVKCVTLQYFDTTTLACQSCLNTQNQNSYLQSECYCKSGYVHDTTVVGFRTSIMCVDCSAQHCQCTSTEAYAYNNLAGALTRSCVKCAANAILSFDQSQCIPCLSEQTAVNGVCACIAGYVLSSNICIKSNADAEYTSQTAITSATQVTFTEGATQNTVNSQFIGLNYIAASIGCTQYNDMIKCQMLANMCVLNLYSIKNIICKEFQQYSKLQPKVGLFDEGWHQGFPWLYYSKIGKLVLQDSSLQFQVSFTGSNFQTNVNILNFYISKFYPNGTFIGTMPLTNELIICGASYNDQILSKKFGVNYHQSCTIDIKKFAQNHPMLFYELFILDSDQSLYPVPILVTNYLNAEGQFENQQNSDTYKFTRRFFMFDNIGGSESTSESSKLVNLRYASQVEMVVTINPNSNQRIYVPYCQITYSFTPVPTTGSAFVSVNYSTQYNATSTSFWNTAIGLFIVANIFAITSWIIRLYIWTFQNPSSSFGDTYGFSLIYRSVLLLLDSWAELMFYYLFIMTGYWFIFYKLQTSIFTLLPSQNNSSTYTPFNIVFVLMFICRMINTVDLIYCQGQIEIFFLDWEKTQILRPKELTNLVDGTFKNLIDKYKNKVSVWRTLLLANELSEITTYRIISIEWTLFFYLFLMIGLKWKYLTNEDPYLDFELLRINQNHMLFYFLTTFVMLIMGVAQIFARKLVSIWHPLCYHDIVDLCTIANISVFIIDQNVHGYYIHGENPVGFSEGSSNYLQNCLNYESQGKGKNRSFILPESNQIFNEDLQCFEIFISQQFKNNYDSVFKDPLNELTNKKQNQGRNSNFGFGQFIPDVVPIGLEMQEVELAKQKLAFYLKDILTQVRKASAKCIKDKFIMQRFLNFPPQELKEKEFQKGKLPLFYKDFDYSFTKMFYVGNEYYHLLSDIILLNFLCYLIGEITMGTLLTFLCIKLLKTYRKWLGERNFADKTKIDQRFLG